MEPFPVSRKPHEERSELLAPQLASASVGQCGLLKRQTMPVVRLHEVGSVLALILLLLIAKHVPLVNTLPLTNITGIVCFTFAIFLSLRIFQVELARIRAEE
jgi:hypothetical protein